MPNLLYKSATKLLLFFGIRKRFVHFFTFFVVFFLETYRKVSKDIPNMRISEPEKTTLKVGNNKAISTSENVLIKKYFFEKKQQGLAYIKIYSYLCARFSEN